MIQPCVARNCDGRCNENVEELILHVGVNNVATWSDISELLHDMDNMI